MLDDDNILLCQHTSWCAAKTSSFPPPLTSSQSPSKIQVASSPQRVFSLNLDSETWVSVPVLPFANGVLWQAAKWVLASSPVKGRHYRCPWWGQGVFAAGEHSWTVRLSAWRSRIMITLTTTPDPTLFLVSRTQTLQPLSPNFTNLEWIECFQLG